MNTDNVKSRIEKMKANVEPWHQALADPVKAQEIVLERLLKGYSQTEYGRKHHSEKVGSYADFQKAFPVNTFDDYKPYIDQVMAGNTHVLLTEEPIAVVCTKGTTGKPKLFPYTPTHAKLFLDIYTRLPDNYSLYKNDFEWRDGYKLTLIPSAKLGKMKIGERELDFGYSLAVTIRYADEVDKMGQRVTPNKEDMELLPKEPSKINWEKRYELAYQQAREKDVSSIYAMPNVAAGFGRYLYREHHVYPKDVWRIKYLPSGGQPGGNTRYAPLLHSLYGNEFNIRDMYISTEAGYGIQLDDKKAWSPLYDHLFFEIQTISGIKPLREMYPGEIGTLVVSTPDLPRYRIGDLILAFEAPYFRCIGRENTVLHPYSFGKLVGKSAIDFTKSAPLHSWR